MMVDVIIPAYNAVLTLERAVTSVLMQGESCRLLLIDDGSTDGTDRLCDELAHHPQVEALHQAHRGVSAARNAGLNAATAEWILFLDADDALYPGAVGKLLADTGDAQAIFGRVNKIEAQDEQVPDEEPSPFADMRAEIFPARNILKYALAHPTKMLHTHGWMLKREICTPRFNEDLSLGEDGEWMMRVLRGTKTVALSYANVYYYYVRSDSTIHRGVDTRAYLRTLAAAQETLDTLNMPDEAAEYRLTHLLLMLTHGIVRQGNLLDVARQCREIRDLSQGEFREDLARVRNLPLDAARTVWKLMRMRCYLLVWLAVRMRQKTSGSRRSSRRLSSPKSDLPGALEHQNKK